MKMVTIQHVFLLCLATILIGQLTMTQSQVLFSKAGLPPINRSGLMQGIARLSQSSESFAFDIIEKLSHALHQYNTQVDFMISPFAIWSLLLLVMEGAAGNSLIQLRNALHVTDNTQSLRAAFNVVQEFLQTNTSTIELASLQAIFTDMNRPVKNEYSRIVESEYGSKLFTVDFHNLMETYETINEEVKRATRGLIPHTILPSDLDRVNLMLLSTLYFKGQWKLPFKRSLTHPETFYDENFNPMGMVDMMVQKANYNYTDIAELKAHVLELPYGHKNLLSMYIILPKKGIQLNDVVHNLRNLGLQPIIDKLAIDAVGYEDDEIEVSLPKFTTKSDFSLGQILNELGITDIFHQELADLSNMADDLFVAHIIHLTKIIVNEEGTEAAAATVALLQNKVTPPKFICNRPFMYLIVEKSTKLVLFAGQVVNPNNLQHST